MTICPGHLLDHNQTDCPFCTIEQATQENTKLQIELGKLKTENEDLRKQISDMRDFGDRCEPIFWDVSDLLADEPCEDVESSFIVDDEK